MTQVSVFDTRDALESMEARKEGVRGLLVQLRKKLEIRSAVDVGCGVGHFTAFLEEMGFEVAGFDGREENVREAKRRHPSIHFQRANIEDPVVLGHGTFDLVFCFGLLYHLENPLLALRHLRALSVKGLLLESMCFPDEQPWMMLRDEPREENQSLTDAAFYPSESCLVKMLYRAGFSEVYRLAALPDHDDFRETREHLRRRTVVFASPAPVNLPGLMRYTEARETFDPWQKKPAAPVRFVRRTQKFLALPPRDKYLSVMQRARRLYPESPIPLRLPFGAWWLARNDNMGDAIREGKFELAETAFVSRFLRPGMTILDVGANQGYYTLLASQRVGSTGQVISFEPAPREKKALKIHKRLNRCKNVSIQECALGNNETEEDLFVVQGRETGCNSLRPPVVHSGTSALRVRVTRLDDWLSSQRIDHVDFIKLDVEGGERDVLRGAERLLERKPRPVILAEVQDIRTEPWGYRAKEVLELLAKREYQWFRLTQEGLLAKLDLSSNDFDGNFVAVPEERMSQVEEMIKDGSRGAA